MVILDDGGAITTAPSACVGVAEQRSEDGTAGQAHVTDAGHWAEPAASRQQLVLDQWRKLELVVETARAVWG
jgi:hypothetical protein